MGRRLGAWIGAILSGSSGPPPLIFPQSVNTPDAREEEVISAWQNNARDWLGFAEHKCWCGDPNCRRG